MGAPLSHFGCRNLLGEERSTKNLDDRGQEGRESLHDASGRIVKGRRFPIFCICLIFVIPGSSSTSQHHHTTVSSEINKHDFSATYLPDTVFPIALSRPHFTRHQSKHRASRITTTTPATMNLGSFGKLSIVYAVLALFLIIELGLTGYGKLSTSRSALKC